MFTLSMLTGLMMLVAGFLRAGSLLRFVSNAVMVGFLSAVGVNIVLGQLANLTGYQATGANRVIRAVNTVLHPGQLHLQSVAVGLVTIAPILLLERTRLGPLGLVVAVIVTSAAVAALGRGSAGDRRRPAGRGHRRAQLLNQLAAVGAGFKVLGCRICPFRRSRAPALHSAAGPTIPVSPGRPFTANATLRP